MIELIIAAIVARSAYKKIVNRREKKDYIEYQDKTIQYLTHERNYVCNIIYNEKEFIALYDKINRYAKKLGYRGATDFFYYLADYTNEDMVLSYARFINKMRYIRNDIAHNGKTYKITDMIIGKLKICWQICKEYDRLLND